MTETGVVSSPPVAALRAMPDAVALRPHPEERPLGRVSKDGRESMRGVDPSRRLLRKLLRMRSVFFTGSEERALSARLEGWATCHMARYARRSSMTLANIVDPMGWQVGQEVS